MAPGKTTKTCGNASSAGWAKHGSGVHPIGLRRIRAMGEGTAAGAGNLGAAGPVSGRPSGRKTGGPAKKSRAAGPQGTDGPAVRNGAQPIW